MTTLTTMLIALLMSLGILDSPNDANNLTTEQEQQISEIIINDELGL